MGDRPLYIVGKHRTWRRHKRLGRGVSGVVFVTNIIHCVFYRAEDISKLQEFVQELEQLNPGYGFEIKASYDKGAKSGQVQASVELAQDGSNVL